MAQALYYWDENKHFDHTQLFLDDQELPTPLPTNATNVAPDNGLYGQATWNGMMWVGMDQAAWQEDQPTPKPATPTTDQAAQAQLALQFAKGQQAQATFNSEVLLQLADLKKNLSVNDDTTTTTTGTNTTADSTTASTTTTEN